MCISATKFLRFLLCFVCLTARAQRDLAGTPEIELALKRLNVLGSVLMIAAHPDDENTAVLAYFARGRGMRTGYLSATRGEGGQNLIGPEQGDLLGVIRTQELLAARRIDGARQFFTRAIDFGFSKSADETLAKWGREQILSDMVWVIRRFRPDVIVLRFSGTPRDGHGQHQASAILGKEAYAAAADPQRFPEQLRFVKPWQARRLVWNTFSFTREQEKSAAALPNRVEIDTGEYDPVLGHSYNEIAGMSRSQHRSQGMGAPERRGPSKNYMVPVAGEPARKDLFDGIDTSWTRVSGGAEAGRILAEAAATLEPHHPEKIIPLLLKARPIIAALKDPWAREKLRDLDETVALCSGLWLDTEADRYDPTPGSSLEVRTVALNRSPFPLRLEAVAVNGIAVQAPPADLLYNRPVQGSVQQQIPAGHPFSQPFWLVEPKQGAAYRIDDQKLIGDPDNLPLFTARFSIAAGDQRIELDRPVIFRYVDHVRGELTRPVIVVPPAAVNLAQDVDIFPNNKTKRVQIEVRAQVENASGDLRIEAPAGWRVEPASRNFKLSREGEVQPLDFEISPPAGEVTATLRAVARVNGTEIASGMHVIDYEHIPPQAVFPPAAARLVRADIQPGARTVGYIMGAGDQMPEALRQMGCEVTLLTPADLVQRNLAEFDTIVTGVRAYNTRPDLEANQGRLLEYVKNGGTLVVQYNTLDRTNRDIGAPYPLTIGRDRVTVEDAPVAFPHPESPLLHRPNPISARDFEGWVQERGLYFASKWDPRYQTVLESHDPGEQPHAGGELYAHYGKGVYIFTAYSWFRQLPAGVPGAYRLFANLIGAK